MKKLLVTIGSVIAFGATATVALADSTLEKVKKRGVIVCGVHEGLPGFGLPDEKGNWSGLDVDFCRAYAAAIFSDPTKVKFRPLNAKDRFTALQSGEVDVLTRNTTWTMSRETTLGFLFASPNYYDGQGFIVRKKLNVTSATQLDGATICVGQGTTTELNLADYFRSHDIKYEPVAFADADEVVKAYDSGRCDVYTDDATGLYGERIKMAVPDDNVILPEIISKEPLAPAVRQGDDKWFNVVRWSGYAMVQAEELGVTSKNADEMLKSDNPEIKRLLGVEGDFGKSLGLSNDWAYQIIKKVGNYGEDSTPISAMDRRSRSSAA